MQNRTVMNKIFGFFDSRTLVVNAPLVNREWNTITLQDELKDNIELSKSRLIITKKILPHCDQFQHETGDSFGLKRIHAGWTNQSYIMTQGDNHYVVRLPGAKTDTLTDRKAEAFNARAIHTLGINPEIIFAGPDGIMVTRYIENAKTMSLSDCRQPAIIDKFVKSLKAVHDSPIPFANTQNYFEKIRQMANLLAENKVILAPEYAEFFKKMEHFEKLYHPLNIINVPCHGDAAFWNVLYAADNPDKLFIIDWESSSNNDPITDLSYFSIGAQFTEKEEAQLLQVYHDKKEIDPVVSSRLILFKPLIYCWMALWGNVQLMNHNFTHGKEGLIQYEQDRREHCRRIFSSPEYTNALDILEKHVQINKFTP